jgi:hypothetical protein
MKSLQTLSLLVLASFLFAACSKETSKEVEEAVDAVAAESKENLKQTKEQLAEVADNAKAQVAETVEAVKENAQVIVDQASKEIAEVKEAAAKKIEVIVEETKDLKTNASTQLQGMFNQKVEEATSQAADVE